MSPTDAIVIRSVDLSGDIGAAESTGAGTESVGGASAGLELAPASGCGGIVEQAVSVSSRSSASDLFALGTETNNEHVDLCRAQSTPEHIQFVQVINRSDAHTMIGLVVDGDPLDC